MEQLFKCKTVKQRKIMEWLVSQGITRADVTDAKLCGSAMMRFINPAGQHMALYCDAAYNVRILQVPPEREEELLSYFWDESNDPETQEWRDELTEDEAAMVEQWDEQTADAIGALAQRILELENSRGDYLQTSYEPEM